jgi:hypothetical protein
VAVTEVDSFLSPYLADAHVGHHIAYGWNSVSLLGNPLTFQVLISCERIDVVVRAQPSLNGDTSGANGAVVVTAAVPPNTNATLTITFGWFFPERDHFGKVFGNYYKNLFSSSVGPWSFGGLHTCATSDAAHCLARGVALVGKDPKDHFVPHDVAYLPSLRYSLATSAPCNVSTRTGPGV